MQSILSWLAGGVGVIFFLGFAIFSSIVGYLGVEYHLGSGWAIGCLIAAFIFRFSLPLTIGFFFGLLDVLGWNIFLATLVTFPTLIFMIPGAIAMALVGVSSIIKGKSKQTYQPSYTYGEPKDVTPLKEKTKKKRAISKKTKKQKKLLREKKTNDFFFI